MRSEEEIRRRITNFQDNLRVIGPNHPKEFCWKEVVQLMMREDEWVLNDKGEK